MLTRLKKRPLAGIVALCLVAAGSSAGAVAGVSATTRGPVGGFRAELLSAATPIAEQSGGQGYWLAASDGGVFTYGDAHFYGSLASDHLKSPIVGILPTPDGKGYWLVAKNGQVYPFGDAARFHAIPRRLNGPVVGIAAYSIPKSGLRGPVGPRGRKGAHGSKGPRGFLGPRGSLGPIGPKGPPGPQGLAGLRGTTGAAGKNGASLLSGAGAPSNGGGSAGDFYLDTTSSVLYGPKVGGAWPLTGVSLVGPRGADGASGATGATGSVGATGASGATGAAGPTGAAGATGATGCRWADWRGRGHRVSGANRRGRCDRYSGATGAARRRRPDRSRRRGAGGLLCQQLRFFPCLFW